MNDDPTVFGDGVATLTLGMRGMRIYVGTHQLKYVKSIQMKHNGETGVTELELIFPSSHDPEIARAIEENMRLARTIPWIKVTY